MAMVVACVGGRLRRLDMFGIVDMLAMLGMAFLRRRLWRLGIIDMLGMVFLGRWLRRLCTFGFIDLAAVLLLATWLLGTDVLLNAAVFAVPLVNAMTGGVLRGRVRLVKANPSVCHLAGHRWVAVE
jgi:hypothetical protein